MKKVMAVLCVAVLLLSLMPATAFAAAEANHAFIGIGAPSDWTLSWWGEGDEGNDPSNGVVGTDAVVDGPGQYTTSVDFTGTEAGSVGEIQFMGLMIQGFEAAHPGWVIDIDSIKVNGEEVEVGKTYTSCDADGKDQMRVNLYNAWVGELPDDARTADGSLDDATPTPVDVTTWSEVQTIEVTFTVIDPNAPAEEEVEEEEATADVPKTGVVGLGIVYGLGALATGAVALKRRQR